MKLDCRFYVLFGMVFKWEFGLARNLNMRYLLKLPINSHANKNRRFFYRFPALNLLTLLLKYSREASTGADLKNNLRKFLESVDNCFYFMVSFFLVMLRRFNRRSSSRGQKVRLFRRENDG